jgi:integrase
MSVDTLPETIENDARAIQAGGKHPDKALSAAKVRMVSEPGHYCDGNCLYLVVDENGAKKWVLRVTIHGRRRDLGLGSARLVSLAEAREEAIRLRKIARSGGDPYAERRKERQARSTPTFEEAARLVYDAHKKTFRNERHAAQWISSLETYAFPHIGKLRIDHVESSNVLQVLSPIWTNIPETARRVKQRMKTVFDWAKANNYCAGSNPTEGMTKALPKHKTKQKHHAALPFADLPAFIQSLRIVEQSSESIKLALEFLILTTSRRSEVLLAKWSEIDLDKKTWTVPAERMKAKDEHKVPLAPRCLEILISAKAMSNGGDYIFPGRSPRRPLSNMSFLMMLRRMNRADITVHGFRSTFRDWAEEKTNFPNSVIEAALAHTVKNKVEAAYLRTKLFGKRVQLAEVWAQFAIAPAAKVVSIRA